MRSGGLVEPPGWASCLRVDLQNELANLTHWNGTPSAALRLRAPRGVPYKEGRSSETKPAFDDRVWHVGAVNFRRSRAEC
jgi:hypothetical protein